MYPLKTELTILKTRYKIIREIRLIHNIVNNNNITLLCLDATRIHNNKLGINNTIRSLIISNINTKNVLFYADFLNKRKLKTYF